MCHNTTVCMASNIWISAMKYDSFGFFFLSLNHSKCKLVHEIWPQDSGLANPWSLKKLILLNWPAAFSISGTLAGKQVLRTAQVMTTSEWLALSSLLPIASLQGGKKKGKQTCPAFDLRLGDKSKLKIKRNLQITKESLHDSVPPLGHTHRETLRLRAHLSVERTMTDTLRPGATVPGVFLGTPWHPWRPS